MGLLVSILVIVASSLGIYAAGKYFANASSQIGDYFRLPRDVKGATFDAVSSSLPELLVALYSVVLFKQFEVGVGTVAGSALFNLLVIPGICVLVSPVVFRIGRDVISRDALFYLVAVFTLIVLIIYFKTWGIFISLILLVAYLIYITEILRATQRHRKRTKKRPNNNTHLPKQILVFLMNLGLIGLFAFFLTKHSIALSEALKIPSIVIAFTVTAAATSLPDTIISAVNARKGNLNDAISNVFGSNIFDIFVGLGLPLLIYSIIKGSVQIAFNNLEIVLGLMFATIISIYFFLNDDILDKKEASILLFMYLVFMAYIVILSINTFG